MTAEHSDLLKKHYNSYSYVIKPLVATYEAREQQFPTPIFNEIRAFNDHVSRCYLDDATDEFIQEEIKKAGRHTTRIILDLYKYLIISFDNEIKAFESRTKNVNISVVDNGEFYIKYKTLRDKSIFALREAKKKESLNHSQENIFEKFEESFNLYQETSELISSSHSNIQWACWKSNFRRYGWIAGIIIGALTSFILQEVLNWSFLNWIYPLFC